MRGSRGTQSKPSVLTFVLLAAQPFVAAAPRPLGVLDHSGPAAGMPTALASADFDEDGMPDLIVSYSSESGGAIVIHRGNLDAVYPHAPAAQWRQAEGAFVDRPFLPGPGRTDLSFGADFVGAGDFDNDGHQDVVVGTRGETRLTVLTGDGHGGLSASGSIDLGASLVALIAGDVNRADGVPDVVVAVSGAGGPALLIFESPSGVVDSDPEVVPLPAVPTLLTLARTRDNLSTDIVAAADDELLIVGGPDSRLERLAVPSAIASLAWGDFLAESAPHSELAVVTDDGRLSFVDLEDRDGAVRLEPIDTERYLAPGSTVIGARLSGLATQDLLILDPSGRPARVIGGLRRPDGLGAEWDAWNVGSVDLEALSYPEVKGRPRAVLAMRLNADARPDLVLLEEGSLAPTLAVSSPQAVITVNSSLDNTTPGNGQCTLREAINNANSNSDTTAGDCTAGAGLDTIAFAIAGGGSIASIAVAPPALPAITDSVVIDGTTQGCSTPPCVELNGAGAGAGVTGLRLTGAGGSTVRGLVVNRFTAHGIYATTSGNVIEGNRVGTDWTGMAAQGNGSTGIRLNGTGATSNTIGGAAAAARNLVSGNTGGGIVLIDGPALNTVLGNHAGIDAAGASVIPNQVGIYLSGVGTSSNTIGGTAPGAGNVTSGNSNRGIQLYADSGGNTVQGNLVGVDPTGSTALGNGQSGIWAYQSSNNLIGGTAANARNVVSGNTHYGISLEGSSGNTVSGNYVGTDATGTIAIGNLYSGILLYGASSSVVGGTTPEARNVVSGNIQSGIYLYGGSSGNTVSGNYVGTDAAGTNAIPNTNGIYSSGVGTSSNTIGGTAPGAGNVASGNSYRGIQLYADSGGNTVQGNLVGVDPTGSTALGNGRSGIWVYQSNNNLIGGTVTGARNVISGNATYGISLEGSSSNTVSGNYVGTDANGATAIGNALAGILLFGASSNTIGGTTPEARNVASGNNGGIFLAGASNGNQVAGNYVGIDATGTIAIPNRVVGIEIESSTGNTIGPGNVASGNYTIGDPDVGFGILLDTGADGNSVVGNFVGTDPTGTFAIGNARAGIRLLAASNNVVGGTTPEARNISSGNGRNGVSVLSSADNNQVLGNYLGVDVTGSLAIPNGGDGAEIEAAMGNTIGPGNVISGNAEVGVFLESSAVGNTVRGNYVGTDATGTTVIGNGRNGIQVGCTPSPGSCGEGAATSNVIGGTTPEARNVVAGSGRDGVFLMNGSDDNVVQGNAIGTDATGTLTLGNSGNGVRVLDSTGVRIGGALPGEGNLIVNNGGAGVVVQGTSMDSPVLGNVIAGNAQLGIDLGESDGVTPNDPGDADTGPNGLQNFPLLTSVESSPAGIVVVAGTLNSTPASSFRIEFFSNGSCDASGHGEGRRYLGSADVVTDGSGTAAFSTSLAALVQAGETVAATATSATNSTSEFSACNVASCSSAAVFTETVVAPDRDHLSWASPTDVHWVKGDISQVGDYTPLADGELAGASSLDISADEPPPGSGLYYLVRPLLCGSWQTELGSEPGRDSSLP